MVCWLAVAKYDQQKVSILKVDLETTEVENVEDYEFEHSTPTVKEVGTNILAVASGPQIHILNLCQKQISRSLSIHSDNVLTFAKLKPNLPIVVSSGMDRVLMAWKLTTGEVLGRVNTDQLGAISSALAMKKTLILASLDHTIAVYDTGMKTVH